MDAPHDRRQGKRMALHTGRLRTGWVRQFCADANDGIIGAAGVLQGFSGAGGSSHLLLVASVTTMIAGSLALFGTTYAQESAERDAQLRLIAEEAASLVENPTAEIEELTTRFVDLGVARKLAREVAEDMHEHSRWEPNWTRSTASVSRCRARAPSPAGCAQPSAMPWDRRCP